MAKKDKKKDQEEDGENKDESRPDYEELASRVTVISKPLASRKLTKKVYKTVKKATKAKSLRRGVKEVVKAIRKGEKGLVIIAGDVSPIDVISHIPVMCEDTKLPYVYVPSKVLKIVLEHRVSHEESPTDCDLLENIFLLSWDFSPVLLASLIYMLTINKSDLGVSSMTKRPTSIVLIKPHQDFQESYEECVDTVKTLPRPI